MANGEQVDMARPQGIRARLFAFTALGLLAASVGYVGQQGYLAATDSFIAPIILSPDNDLVLASKLHGSQLAVERARTASEAEAVDEALAAGQKALGRLRVIQRAPASSFAWTSDRSSRQVTAGATEQRVLMQQHAVLVDMAEKQEHLVTVGRDNLAAGLISTTELTRALQTQNELRLAMLENERTRLQTNIQMSEAALTKKSLTGDAPPMPEVMMREEQMVRVELEIMRLESEQRSKLAEKKLLTDKLATLDELEAQLKARPIFRASERRIDAAFLPYTQSKGVRPGAVVYECVWGAFHCKPVGAVAEVVPGEVVLPDPWGNQARGQYLVLTLSEHDSAKARTLRVRSGSAPPTAPASEPGDRVSVK
jgi:hypothetical protein